jgi:hypothetical protein
MASRLLGNLPTVASVAVQPHVVPEPSPQTQIKDGRTWRIGADEELAWINDGITAGPSTTASIPPIFAAYATPVFPLELESSREQARPAEDHFDDALLRVLCTHTKPSHGGSGSLIPAPAMSSSMTLRA